MDRRSSIKTLLTFSVGIVVLPGCLQQEDKSSFNLKNFKITGQDEKLIKALIDTLIPQGKAPGAIAVGAFEFTLMMVDECYSNDNQKQFIDGLREFDDVARARLNKPFAKALSDERNVVLNDMESNIEKSVNLSFFYENTKQLTLRAFTQSKYYLTEVQEYKLVPGKFYGCVAVKQIT